MSIEHLTVHMRTHRRQPYLWSSKTGISGRLPPLQVVGDVVCVWSGGSQSDLQYRLCNIKGLGEQDTRVLPEGLVEDLLGHVGHGGRVAVEQRATIVELGEDVAC